MSDHLPLEGTQRRVTLLADQRAESDAGGQGWLLRILLGWHASFALMGIVLAVLFAVVGDPWYSYLVLGVVAAAYVTIGAPAFRGDRSVRAGWLFLGIAFLGSLLLTMIDLRASVALYVLLPAAFALVEPIKLAIWQGVVMTLATDLIVLVKQGWTGSVLTDLAAQNATTWLFAVLVGFFVTQMLVENQRRGELIRELESVRSELTSAHHDAGVRAERYRLAQEIHDTLGQGLTSLLMLIRAADAAVYTDPDRARERLRLAQRTATENLAEARAVVTAIGPADLLAAPLDAAIRNVSARLEAELGIPVVVEVSGAPVPLNADVQVVLLRMVQESLANVRKHARASRVDVRMRYAPHSVQVEVEDDGCGFDPAQANGFGLRGIRSRAEQVSGSVRVETALGGGTRISVEVALT